MEVNDEIRELILIGPCRPRISARGALITSSVPWSLPWVTQEKRWSWKNSSSSGERGVGWSGSLDGPRWGMASDCSVGSCSIDDRWGLFYYNIDIMYRLVYKLLKYRRKEVVHMAEQTSAKSGAPRPTLQPPRLTRADWLKRNETRVTLTRTELEQLAKLVKSGHVLLDDVR